VKIGFAMIAGLRRTPYGPLIPWIALAGFLGAACAAVHVLVLMPAQAGLEQQEAAWRAAREQAAQRLVAREARQNLTTVLNALPTHRDFAQLPFAISKVAKKDGVMVPRLSSSLEKAESALFAKAVLRGAATGRYEDLRRFIHHLERTEGFLFIENLDVGHQSSSEDGTVTVTMTLRTSIRGGPGPQAPARGEAP
jgi:Tfp pilus assembly protein PilO